MYLYVDAIPHADSFVFTIVPCVWQLFKQLFFKGTITQRV